MIMLAAGGGFFVWERYLSPQAKLNLEAQANYQKYLDWEANYEKAMREDTYGGKTPQETLDMFVAALRAGDVELASKYFMLNASGKVDEKWINGLKKTKEEGRFSEVANLLSKALPILQDRTSNEDYRFAVYDTDGSRIKIYVNLELNVFSKIWKIESL